MIQGIRFPEFTLPLGGAWHPLELAYRNLRHRLFGDPSQLYLVLQHDARANGALKWETLRQINREVLQVQCFHRRCCYLLSMM